MLLKTKDFPKIYKNRKKIFQNLCQIEDIIKNGAKNCRVSKNVPRNRKCSTNVAKKLKKKNVDKNKK